MALGAIDDGCQLDQPLLALAVFSALHLAPALPQVLLVGTRRLCRWRLTRSAPSGAGSFLHLPWDSFRLIPCLFISISDPDVEGFPVCNLWNFVTLLGKHRLLSHLSLQ